MKFTFGVDHTRHGCTAWMEMPSGRRSKAKFRNTCYVAAMTKAEQWVWEQRKILLEEAESRGLKFEIEVPPELDRQNDRKYVTLPVSWWAAIEDQAKSQGVGWSDWMREAIKEKLPTSVTGYTAEQLRKSHEISRPAKSDSGHSA